MSAASPPGKSAIKSTIRPFQWEDWAALWALRNCQLTEEGIPSGSNPSQPDFESPYERDYHRIESVYLCDRGNFWIAWMKDQPVGHIGGQDMGDFIELRRMYVCRPYRRRGIGTQLVDALIDHSRDQGAQVIQLWTDPAGPGRPLYQKFGFDGVKASGSGGKLLTDAKGGIRMSLSL